MPATSEDSGLPTVFYKVLDSLPNTPISSDAARRKEKNTVRLIRRFSDPAADFFQNNFTSLPDVPSAGKPASDAGAGKPDNEDNDTGRMGIIDP